MPERQKETIGNSGANEEFWDSNYQEHRYRQDDGSLLPVYDRVLTEAACSSQRYDPNEEDHKRSLHRSRLSKRFGD